MNLQHSAASSNVRNSGPKEGSRISETRCSTRVLVVFEHHVMSMTSLRKRFLVQTQPERVLSVIPSP